MLAFENGRARNYRVFQLGLAATEKPARLRINATGLALIRMGLHSWMCAQIKCKRNSWFQALYKETTLIRPIIKPLILRS